MPADSPPNRPMVVAPRWIERHCVVPDGIRRGAPFKLYNFQARYITNFYLVRGTAVWHPTAPMFASAFVYRRGLLIGPQGIGKDPVGAAHICLEGVGPALFADWAPFAALHAAALAYGHFEASADIAAAEALVCLS